MARLDLVFPRHVGPGGRALGPRAAGQARRQGQEEGRRSDAAREGVRVNSHYLMQCDVESPGPKSWKSVFLGEPGIILEDVDFCNTHMVLILRQGRKLRLCSVNLPLPENIKVPAHLADFQPFDLPLPNHVCQILSGPNYDYYSSTMRFTISSPVVVVSIDRVHTFLWAAMLRGHLERGQHGGRGLAPAEDEVLAAGGGGLLHADVHVGRPADAVQERGGRGVSAKRFVNHTLSLDDVKL